MNITRRAALRGAVAIAVTGAVPMAAMASTNRADPLLEGVQALVNEIRRGLDPNVPTAWSGKPRFIADVDWALQQAADRLEALPGIEAVINENWTPRYRVRCTRYGMMRVLRPAGETIS